MSVASRHYDLLDACVSSAFKDILSSQNADSAHQCPDDALQAGRCIQAAIHAALQRCYNAWNSAHRDALLRLPRELVLDCFELLDFKGRKAVTHVSRAWRSLALSDFRLWNSVSFQRRRSAVALDMLTTFLQRSDPKPFALSSMDSVGAESRAVFDLIIKNIHRMESIKIDSLQKDDLALLFSQRAPLLRTFVYSRPLSLSWLWDGDMVPCLETTDVQLSSVSAPFRPIASVRKLGGRLGPNAALPDILKIFPGVTSLDLHDVTQQFINNFGSLVPSLVCLSLRGWVGSRELDYTPIIPALTRLDLASLCVDSSAAISGLVQLFVEKTRSERRIEILSRCVARLASDADNINFTITTRFLTISLARDPPLPALLRAFSTLSLSTELLVEMHGSLPKADHALPNMRSLTIVLSWTANIDFLSIIRASKLGPMDAPQLRSLSFSVPFVDNYAREEALRKLGNQVGRDLPAFLPLILSYPRPNIRSITMLVENPVFLARSGADNMVLLASGLSVPELKVQNIQTGDETTFSVHDDVVASG